MKIFVTGTRGIPGIMGGVERHCEELFPRIAARGFDVTVIRRASYIQDHLQKFKGVKLLDIPSPRKKSFEAIIHTFRAILQAKRLHADILHIHAIGPALLTPMARLLGMKVVFTHHGPDYERAKWGVWARLVLKAGEYMGCKYANEVIAVSEMIGRMIKRKYNRQDVHLIYNGVSSPIFIDDTAYLESLGIYPRKYILAMGRFVPEKNFHQLIEVFSRLAPSDYRLILAGDADFEDEYSACLKMMSKKKNVVLTGFIKGEKLYTLLSHARAFVLPSSYEGLSISLLEAMSYRLPVVASDIVANLQIGLPEENYFRTGNERELSKKLHTLVTTPFTPTDYPMKVYNWENIAEQVAEIYSELFDKMLHRPSTCTSGREQTCTDTGSSRDD